MAIFCLIGHSASGKSSIERVLESKGYPRIISYTTRPMRKNESYGVDYNFVSNYEFNELEEMGFFQETASYREWKYGLSLEGIDYKNKHYIVVVTKHGYEELVKVAGKENIVAIFVEVSERTRMKRLLERGDEVDEIIRRIQNDRVDFKGMEELVDYIIPNQLLDIAVMQVEAIISNTSKRLNKR